MANYDGQALWPDTAGIYYYRKKQTKKNEETKADREVEALLRHLATSNPEIQTIGNWA